jgi:uncharacterized membrane protein
VKLNLFKNFDARPRLIIAVGLAVFVSFILPPCLHLPTRILCAWNPGVDFFLAVTWWKMIKANPEKIRRYAESEYEGHLAILMLVIAAACASVLAIGFLLTDKKGLSTILLTLHVILSIMTIVGSWLLVHTMFAVQYAHSYYKCVNRNNSEKITGGLDFPDYWEFLYYSFVIGMTSQVSDVQTTSRNMRRLTLLHGILSFFFNTTILAMSINIIASLI